MSTRYTNKQQKTINNTKHTQQENMKVSQTIQPNEKLNEAKTNTTTRK